MRSLLTLLTSLCVAIAYPNMGGPSNNVLSKLSERANVNPLEPDSIEMIGDLRPQFNGGTGGPKTDVGWIVWGILTGSAPAQSTT